MGDFEGYLFKSTTNDTVFPNHYIVYDSWQSTPNVREEIKAVRDDNTRELYRVTSEGTKSNFSFDIPSHLHKKDKEAIQAFFTNAEVDSLQRKIQLTYWNDEDCEYKTSYFYRPDITFTIQMITNNDIIYNGFTVELIEY